MSKAVKVEIWSDVMCPFCYIGKRKFERALATFDHKEQVQIEWKAFQLYPNTRTDTSVSIYDMLATKKGISKDQARMMIANVSRIGSSVGVELNFDKSVVANSLKAHRFSAFAKSKGKSVEATEQLFKAHFTDNKNTDDTATLVSLGTSIGLDETELQQVLESTAFADEVARDIADARAMGVNGVPYFRFNGKFAVSGAQEPAQFAHVLQRAYDDAKQAKESQHDDSVSQGVVCDIDGNCK